MKQSHYYRKYRTRKKHFHMLVNIRKKSTRQHTRKRQHTIKHYIRASYNREFLSYADIQAIRKYFAKQQKRLNKQAQ